MCCNPLAILQVVRENALSAKKGTRDCHGLRPLPLPLPRPLKPNILASFFSWSRLTFSFASFFCAVWRVCINPACVRIRGKKEGMAEVSTEAWRSWHALELVVSYEGAYGRDTHLFASEAVQRERACQPWTQRCWVNDYHIIGGII